MDVRARHVVHRLGLLVDIVDLVEEESSALVAMRKNLARVIMTRTGPSFIASLRRSTWLKEKGLG